MSTKEFGSIKPFRDSVLGRTLQEAIDDLFVQGRLTQAQGLIILEHLDELMPKIISKSTDATIKMKGHLHTYRALNHDYTFTITDLHISSPEIDVVVPYLHAQIKPSEVAKLGLKKNGSKAIGPGATAAHLEGKRKNDKAMGEEGGKRRKTRE